MDKGQNCCIYLNILKYSVYTISVVNKDVCMIILVPPKYGLHLRAAALLCHIAKMRLCTLLCCELCID